MVFSKVGIHAVHRNDDEETEDSNKDNKPMEANAGISLNL